MTRTPTAEEVLALYVKWKGTEKDFCQAPLKDDEETTGFAMDVINDRDAFQSALGQWHAARGPYSFEWFCSRFGEYVHCNLGSLFAFIDGVELEIKGTSVFFDHPQRSDVEALVRSLSGKDGE